MGITGAKADDAISLRHDIAARLILRHRRFHKSSVIDDE